MLILKKVRPSIYKLGKKYNHPPVARPSASQRARFAHTWGSEIKNIYIPPAPLGMGGG